LNRNSADTGFAAKVGEADEMKVAHRFIGGIARRNVNQSVKRADEVKPPEILFSVVRFTDCRSTPPGPSAEALGYFHSVRCRGRRTNDFCSKALIRGLRDFTKLSENHETSHFSSARYKFLKTLFVSLFRQ